jgi:LL-diaminopimelate aminotransferase
MKRLVGVDCNPQTEIVHCVGTKTALAQIPMAFLNPGDSVIATKPGYPVLPTIASWLGAKVTSLPLYRKNNFLPDLNDLENAVKLEKPKLLLLNYPNNPTGGVATESFIRDVIALAHRYNFLVVQDAAYADFQFDGAFRSFLEFPGGRDCAIELFSLSKSYNMQGYRLGFVVSNPTLLSVFALVKDNIDNGQFIAIQHAGVEALDNGIDFVAANKAKYLRRISAVCRSLQAAGLEANPAAGSFYLYIPVPNKFHGRSFENAQSFTDYLIEKLGIVTVPWEEAGPHVRLSMTFEVGNEHFQNEAEVLSTFDKRITSGQL